MDFAQRICRSKAGNGCFLEATLVVVEVCVSLICKTAFFQFQLRLQLLWRILVNNCLNTKRQEKWNISI